MQIESSLFQPFLIKYRKLPLGKLGTVVLQQEPAFHEYTSQVIRPVREVLGFSPKTDAGLMESFEAFAEKKGVDKSGVQLLIDQIKSQLNKNKEALLVGIGTLKIENNVYKLVGEDVSQDYLAPVTAGAVIHEGDVHDVKVGEEVHSSEEMKAMLAAKKTKDYWWVYALILLVVAIAAILYSVYGDKL
jgi:hypothetical protein